jgi:hypothetical protein
MSHRIARSLPVSRPEQLSDVPYGCSFGLDLLAFGGHAGAFRLGRRCQIASGVPLKSSARSP